MSNRISAKIKGHLVWVFPGILADALDSATWLQTTHQLRSFGWRVTLVCVGPSQQTTINGIEVLSIPSVDRFFLRSTAFHWRLLKFMLKEWNTIDVILFHQMTGLWMLALLPYRKLRGDARPLLVMDTRDLNAVDGTLKNRMRALYYRLVHRLANRWTDGQTAITGRMAALVQIPNEQLWGLWPSGVEVARFASAHAERHWPQPGEPVQLMYVGILLRERNLLALCHAVQQANEAGMAFQLTFVGGGPDQPSLEEAAAQSAGQIRVLAPVLHDQVPALLSQAHVGVTSLPAPENEKFQASSPIKLFEYMAAGLPVLATRIACHTDVVQAGRYAFWAENASTQGLLAALRAIWQGRDDLARLGQEARLAADDWSWQAAARQLSEALANGLTSRSVAVAQQLVERPTE